jgi:O-antigen ligase
MKKRLDAAEPGHSRLLPRLFALYFGAFLGLTLLKFGNPPIFESWVTAPSNLYEFVLGPWPIAWGYCLLGLAVIGALFVDKRKPKEARWILILPLAWLLWQCLATASTANAALSKPTLAHFLGCVVCFYLGVFCLADLRRAAWLLPGLLCGFLIALAIGWQQRFGGLDQTRRYFFLYIYPGLKEVPPEYLKKISSSRIFSTLFYPNALAGAILLLLPVLLEFVWQARRQFTRPARVFLVTAIGIGALACLYWSGSKGGWLLMMILGLIWLLRLPFNSSLKRALVTLMLVAGLAGFLYRYSGFFHKGATSVGARFDYWEAALRTTLSHPWLGTGPGTFSIAYQRVKRPESEMSRLVHNDYLEQASDSGLPGLLFYSGFIIGVLALTARSFIRFQDKNTSLNAQNINRVTKAGSSGSSCRGINEASPGFDTSIAFALWLGVLGWALQGLMEFGLYIPALSWPAFAFMGLLLRHRFSHKVAA